MSKIFKVSFKEKNQKGKTIQELFSSIEFYRSEKRSLRAIYDAFVESSLWSKSWSSFTHEYYQHCRLIDKASLLKKKSLKSDKRESESVITPALDVAKITAMTDAKTENKELTLADRRAIASELFKQKLG
jgi:tellurite resistance protein